MDISTINPLPAKLIFAGSSESQVQITAKLLASGKEQGRLLKVLGESAGVLSQVEFEFRDIKASSFVTDLDVALLILIIEDNNSLQEFDRLVRSKALDLAIDFVVITVPEISTVIRASLRDSSRAAKVFSYNHTGLNQIAYSTVKLIESNYDVSLFSKRSVEVVNTQAQDPGVAEIAMMPVISVPVPVPLPVPVSNIPNIPVELSLEDSLQALLSINGALGACLVDSATGMVLGKAGGATLNLEIAAAGNTEVLRAKQKTLKALGMQDHVEDMLMVLGLQIHILRPLQSKAGLFLYVALDRSRANMALARMKIAEIDTCLRT
jgi:hypothetical protein